MKYDTLLEYQNAVLAGLHPGAVIKVDNDSVIGMVEHFDDDGEECAETEYLYRSERPRLALHLALELLGLESEDV